MARKEADFESISPSPAANPDLSGHAAAEAALRDAYNSGRLPHAWLISGPRGIGKATLAYRFARFVLAQGGKSADGLHLAADHPVFRRVASGGHADLKVIERTPDPKSGKMRASIVIDDVRGAGKFLRLTAAEGGWRVVIVDAADDMNPSSANAILKILEEPPARALLLLVSHNPGRLLPTIRSRCRRLNMPALEAATVAALARQYLPGLGAAEAERLSLLAEGSIGHALALAEVGGLGFHDEISRLLEGLPRLDIEALHVLGDKLGRAGAEDAFRMTTDLLRWWMARLIVSGAKGEGDPLMARLFASGGRQRWLQAWDKTGRILARAETAHLDRKQVTLNLFMTLEKAVNS
jgi:DNA polymerase-3 subunit delta'